MFLSLVELSATLQLAGTEGFAHPPVAQCPGCGPTAARAGLTRRALPSDDRTPLSPRCTASRRLLVFVGYPAFSRIVGASIVPTFHDPTPSPRDEGKGLTWQNRPSSTKTHIKKGNLMPNQIVALWTYLRAAPECRANGMRGTVVEKVIFTAIFAALAIAVGAIIVAKVTAKTNSIT